MSTLREIRDRGYLPPRTMRKLLFVGFLTMGKIVITNLSDIKKLSKIKPAETAYKRPKRRFDLQPFKDDMKVCHSDEKYLRPTLYCDHTRPEIIALAHELGAYKLPDREYAIAAFEFAKRKLTLEMVPLDGVEKTLERGTGTCIHKISVFIALCRAAGLKARYKLYSLTMIDAWSDALMVDPMIKKYSDAMGYFLIHGEGEVFIDGKWEVCDVGPTPERQAASSIPITRFGEDSIGIWFSAVPGTIMRLESIPYGLNLMMRIVKKMAPITVDKVNASVLSQINHGREILQQKGEDEYDAEIRRTYKPKFPEPVLKTRKEIIFKR
jgi:hypothetical protein